MRIRYVWPKRFEDESTDAKPTTYFWVECSPDEAVEVLAAHKFSVDDFRDYLWRVEGVRKHLQQPAEASLGDEFLDSFYSTVAFLVSSDGRRVEPGPITYPIGGMWNGYNPFHEVEPRDFNSLSQLFLAAGDIFNEHPYLADNIDILDIRPRVNLEGSGVRGAGNLMGSLPRNEQDGLNATDDELAMAIFTFQDSKGDGTDCERFKDLAPNLTIELGRQFAARGSFKWRAGGGEYPFKFRFFKAADMPLIEIYARRLRAEKNMAAMMESLLQSGSNFDYDAALWLSTMSDDEVCEMLLYDMHVYQQGPTKMLAMTVEERLRGNHGDLVSYVGEMTGRVRFDQGNDLGSPPPLAGPDDELPPPLGEPEPLPEDLVVAFDLNHPVAYNPFLGQKWVGLARTIEAVIERVRDEDDHCQFQTYGHAFGLSPNTSPFMQAKWNGPILRVEISANLVVRPELTEKQILELEFMGWSVPNEDNPNFERVWDVPALEEVSDFVLTSLVSIYGIEERDFFAFGLVDTPDFVGSLGYLDRLAASDSNRWRAIFCIRGMHGEML